MRTIARSEPERERDRVTDAEAEWALDLLVAIGALNDDAEWGITDPEVLAARDRAREAAAASADPDEVRRAQETWDRMMRGGIALASAPRPQPRPARARESRAPRATSASGGSASATTAGSSCEDSSGSASDPSPAPSHSRLTGRPRVPVRPHARRDADLSARWSDTPAFNPIQRSARI